MGNVFRLAYATSREDYFTACLQYVIENIPALGQDIVDLLVHQTGKSTSKFLKAIDHPFICSKNRPDFLLECEDFDIICEHKLDSPLSESQLERYIQVAEARLKKTYLVFVSNGNHSIGESVLAHERYLFPIDRLYFRWQEIYPLVRKHKKHLANEFAEFMEDFGMYSPQLVESWEDLFENGETAQELNKCWIETREFFASKTGAVCKKSNEMNLGVSKPIDWLHLIYFSFKTSRIQKLNAEPPYLIAHIWILDNHPYIYAFRSMEQAIFSCQYGDIEILTGEPTYGGWKIKGTAQPMCVASYFISLNQLLDLDLHEVERRLKDFAVAVYEHALKTVEEYASSKK